MTTNTTSDLDKILNRVQGLLAKADHPNTGKAEGDAFRAKAEALMIKYRIEEITAKPDAAGAAVEWREITICQADSEFATYYRYLWADVKTHFGIRARDTYNYEGDSTTIVSTVCGYASDLRFAEALFLAASIAFADRLEPKFQTDLSEQVNAYRMRMAGMEGKRIAQAIYGRDDVALRPKVRAMFKAEAQVRGEDPTPLLGKGVNVAGWRKGYAEGFTNEFYNRLAVMRVSRGEAEGGLVLVGRKEAIDEAYYEKYPDLRPAPAGTKALGTYQDQRASCTKCKSAKSGFCREHGWMKPKFGKAETVNHSARNAGAAAARSVDMGATGTRKLA